MPRIMIIHPEGNINNNPNLTGIVEILCEKEYEVDIYSPRVAHIEQFAPCQGANLILTEVGSSELNAVLPLDIFQSTGATENPITCNIPHYDLVIGVDRGIVEASSIARQLGVPYGLISYEILFREETGNEYTMPDRYASRGVSFAVCQDRLRSYHLSQENDIPLERIIDIPVAGRAIKSGIRTTLLHEKLGLPKKTRIALYIGGVTYKWAGIDELIEHSDKWPDNWVLVLHQRYSLYGNEFTNRLSSKKKKNIFISPFPNLAFDKLHILLNAADLGLSFYIPQFQGHGFSDRNNLKYIGMASGKIATYLQHGLPIVINEIGEMSGYVRKHKLGRVVTDFSNLGQILGSIDNAELSTFKDNSYDFYNAHLDLNVTIQPFLKIISTLISSKTRQNHIFDVANVRPEFNLGAEKELSYMVDQNVDGSLSEDVRCYFQPPVGSVETFIDVKPKTVQPCLFSVYQALKGYTINDFGMGLNAVSRIIYHIFKTKLHTPLQWRHDLWHRTLVVQFTSDLVERRTGKLFDILDEIEIARFAQEFLAVEGAERTSCIKEYQEKLLLGLDLGQPLYVSGTVLNYLGASVDPHAIFMIDGARRISAVALNRKKSIEIKLIILEEEYSEQFLEKSSQNEALKAIDQLAWFNNYQSIPLVGIRGQRSLNRFALMDMSLLRDQVVMDFGCNLGQACIKAVMAGAQAVWGVEGMPDTFRIAQEIGRLSGFPNLHYLNVDFNAFDFSRQIDEVYSDQADYAFFFSVYRTKELSQRDTLFRYIIKKTRKGIFFEGHADPVIDTVKYYDWLFESFGLNYQYLGNSEGSLRPLFFIPLAERLTAPPKSPVAPVPAGEQVAFSPMLFRVSAIVSTYASERFIEGRLNDLLEQTLGDQLEIIVVDSNSPENERAIVERYAARHSNIVYIRTDQRETVYQAWNRGARAARGVYLTNANTDDRLRTDALELLAGELDANPSMALVYADFFITGYENMTFNHHIRTGYSIKPDYNPNIMLHGCHMGPQPMWRRSLHDEIGYFDETLVAAGDYEFWCRIACRYPMKHVPLFLGLYLHNPKGICNSNVDLCFNESQQVKERYLNLLPPPRSGLPTGCYYREKVIEGNFVNIGMVTYNRLDFTRQAVAALVEHTDFPYVLTVVDNNSSDGTREYLAELKLTGIIRHLILLDENVGVAKASNLAWSLEPSADYYLKLDNDIVIKKPGWLWEMVRVVEAVTEAGAVGYNFETDSYEAVSAYGVQFRPKSNGNLGGACILIPRRTHDLLGYWCEDYGLYGEEDADYGARIQMAGLFNIYMDDEQVGLHLPAGRAAVIDATLTARDGIEEEAQSEYRVWKDDARRLNVLSGRYDRNMKCYAQKGSAVYLDSAFANAWHARQDIDTGGNGHAIDGTKTGFTERGGRGADNELAKVYPSKPKIGVFVSAPLECACPQLRLISALTCLHDRGELELVDVAGLLENAPATFVEELTGMSALILQRSKIAFWPYGDFGPFLEKTGTKLILEIDDAVMQIPQTNPLYEHFQTMQHEFEEYSKRADLITVSTPYLKALYSHYNKNVIVLPNCIDTKIWKCDPPCEPKDVQLPLKILFSGTPSHVEDFTVLRGAIRRILEEFTNEVELIIWGNMIPEFLTHPSVRFIENYVSDYSQYAINIADLKADIGIVPLQDNVFNNAKSAIKWLEYSVCGIAGIFSNIGEYKDVVSHGKTGLIVANNEADWYAAIKDLIVNRQLRTSIVTEAYNEVMAKHTVAHNAHKWLEAYRSSGCISGAADSTEANATSPCESKINAAISFHQAGQFAKAEPMYRNILATEPDNFDALHLLGVLACQTGRLDESLELLSETIRKHRSHPSVFISLGNTLTSLGRYNEAAEYYQQALELEPDNAGTHYNLGNVLHFLDRNDEAVACYQKALTIKADFIEVHNHLGNALRKLGRLKEAEASLRLALQLNADVPGAHNNLGNVLMDLGRLDEAEASFRRALELKPNYFDAHSNLLFVQNYSACHDSDSHLELARSYGRMVGKGVTARFTSWNCPEPPKPLRVGLVSGDFNNHPVGFFLEDVLAHVDTSRIELIAYCTQRKSDDLTARITPFFSEWRQLEGLDDESAAHLIHKDCVHVLIDLAGHTAYNRLPVFAWKPAPVQVSWLGYSSTTGVPEIDYILGNPYSTPVTESHHFTEAIWQLPETSLCFSFPNMDIEVAPLPALSNGFITFGCFNNLAKLNDSVLSVWASILKALPTSRLFLKNKQLGESSARMDIINRFAAYGVAEDRLLLEGRSPRLEYLKAYNSVDIVLDPFPFPGGTTTVEGLWMGVPFVTKRGDRFISHQGEMIAQNTGLLSEWIANDHEEYVAKALYFSSNLEYLAGLRTILRRHLHLSALFDAHRFARHLEQALWGMWDRFEMNK